MANKCLIKVCGCLRRTQRYTQALPWLKAILPYAGKYLFPAAITAETGTIYLTVLVTVNRYLAVCRPFDSPARRSVESTRLQILAVTAFCVIYNLPRFFEFDVVEVDLVRPGRRAMNVTNNATLRVRITQPTGLSTNGVYRVLYGNLSYSVVMFLVPLVALILLNRALIRVLRTKKAKRAQLLSGRTKQRSVTAAAAPATGAGCDEMTSINGPSAIAKGQGHPDPGGRSEDDITLTLIVVVVVFVLCQTPALFTQLLLVVLGDAAKACPRPFFYYERFSDLMVVANSSVNFIIYCFCSQKFRETVVSVLCRRNNHQHPQQMEMTAAAARKRDLGRSNPTIRVNLRNTTADAGYVTTLEPDNGDTVADPEANTTSKEQLHCEMPDL